MLVLTRRLGEQIVVDQVIHITVLAIKGKKVRLGITAPPDVAVHREEIQRRIEEDASDDADADFPVRVSTAVS